MKKHPWVQKRKLLSVFLFILLPIQSHANECKEHAEEKINELKKSEIFDASSISTKGLYRYIKENGGEWEIKNECISRFEVGYYAERFDIESLGGGDTNHGLYISALLPSIYYKEFTKINDITLQWNGEFAFNPEQQQTGFIYQDNDVYSDFGIYMPLDDDEYIPYALPPNTFSAHWQYSDFGGSDSVSSLSLDYQYYHHPQINYELLVNVGGGYDFSSDDGSDGDRYYIDINSINYFVPENDYISEVHWTMPRLYYEYFSKNNSETDNDSTLAFQTSLRFFPQFLDKSDSHRFFGEITLGHQWDLSDNEPRAEGFYGMINLSAELFDNSYWEGGGSRGRSRGRGRRPR